MKLIRTGIDSKRLNKKVGEMFNEALRTGKVIICPNTSSNFYNYSMVIKLNIFYTHCSGN